MVGTREGLLRWASRGVCGRWSIVAVALLVAVIIGSWPAVVEACPTCKDGLAQSDPAHASLVRGYFWSILFMMSMPFLILFGLGGYFYLTVRRARAACPEGALDVEALAASLPARYRAPQLSGETRELAS